MCVADKRNKVANGKVYWSPVPQQLHGKAIPKGCYKVSIDEAIKPQAIIPCDTAGITTVADGVGTFVAWPEHLIMCDQEVCSLLT